MALMLRVCKIWGRSPGRNDYYFASLFWDVTRQLNVATEVDYRQTVYMAPNTDNDAWVYYFRMRLKF